MKPRCSDRKLECEPGSGEISWGAGTRAGVGKRGRACFVRSRSYLLLGT
jgi:hypothetical protein